MSTDNAAPGKILVRGARVHNLKNEIGRAHV